MRKAPGKRVEGLVSQVHFVPRIILGCNLMPLMLNICVQFIRLLYSCWIPEHSNKTQSGYCIPNLNMTFCFVLSQI